MNGIGWGILMPIGAIMGHYVRRIEAPAGTATWFHLHRASQMLAYLIGTVGFSLGFFISRSSFSLSSLSPAAYAHACIGIAVFTSATVQVLTAIFLRPDKTHKARIFWNMFHYVVGYGIIVLSIFNVFRGYSISNTYPKFWRNPYLVAVVLLGCMALMFQLIHWFLLCKTKSRNNNNKNMIMEQVSDDNGSVISHQEIV